MLCMLKGEADSHATYINVRTLCPNRWTIQAESLGSILGNYCRIQKLLEIVLHETSETEKKARIQVT